MSENILIQLCNNDISKLENLVKRLPYSFYAVPAEYQTYNMLEYIKPILKTNKGINLVNNINPDLYTKEFADELLSIDIGFSISIPLKYLTKEIINKTLDTNISYCQYFPDKYQTPEIAQRLFDSNIFWMIRDDLKTQEMCDYILINDDYQMQSIPFDKINKEIVLDKVKKNIRYFKILPVSCQFKEVVDYVLGVYGSYIKYVANPSNEQKWIALHKAPSSIKFMLFPTAEMLLYSFKKTPSSISSFGKKQRFKLQWAIQKLNDKELLTKFNKFNEIYSYVRY